ncbi:MAG TPA: rod shape-determining protein RodA [Candidatus Scatomonas pullistercoris]|uniref:Rod shape-determining protein RodA n=1 Tax=Candidatus Scatomonas pullistercoris TaxID=2840920 RepID=A0A9D1T966_9FIRM|nr:rod shape-determining protein RodA [Candidatus Scatomonas pullistercoris]
MLKHYKLKDYNFRLIFFLVLLSGIGVMLVNSAEPSLRNRQMMGVICGIILMVIVSLMDYSWILNFYWVIYAVTIGLLLLVAILGHTAGGATRWLTIGGDNGFQFQPTEIAKILLILFFAMYLMKHAEDLNTLKTILKAVFLIAVPLILIVLQPDLKNTITITIIFCLLMFAAGLKYKIIGGVLLVTVPLALLALFLITQTDLPIVQDFQRDRIIAFFNSEDDAYSEDRMQQENSVMAIGSGQLTGKGLNNNEVSTANNGNYVAEIQTDFIFAVAGEELGFVGCFVIILLLFLIILECMRTGSRAKDQSGALICTGVGALVAVQSFINIGVATGILPNTGTPLPFVSYGLSSLLSFYIGMGFVLNAGLQHRTYYGGKKAYEHRLHRA